MREWCSTVVGTTRTLIFPVPAVVLHEPSSPHAHRTPLGFDTAQVLVLMLLESQREAVANAIQSEVQNERLDNALIVYFFVPRTEDENEEVNGGDLPTKALLNAVSDLCQTRCVPHGGSLPCCRFSSGVGLIVVVVHGGFCAPPSRRVRCEQLLVERRMP